MFDLPSAVIEKIDKILSIVITDTATARTHLGRAFGNQIADSINLNASASAITIVAEVRDRLWKFGTVDCPDPIDSSKTTEENALWYFLEYLRVSKLVGTDKGREISKLRSYLMPPPIGPSNNPVLEVLGRSKKPTLTPDTRLMIRREVNFPFYCFLLGENESIVSSGRLKALLGLDDTVFDQLAAHWIACDHLQEDPEGNYIITTEGRKNILAAFDHDDFDYHISKTIPNFSPSMTGIQYCQYMNEIRLPRQSFEEANFSALERCLGYSKLSIERLQIRPNTPQMGIVKVDGKPLFILMIGKSSRAITEDQFTGTYVYHLTTASNRYNHIPALILGTSLLDPKLGRKFHEDQPWVSHMWELSATSFFRQLDAIIKEHPGKKEDIAKNLDAILKDQGVLSISSTQAIRNLKEKVGIPVD